MHETLTQETLRTGEKLDIMVVEAPDREHAGTVLNLLGHKGELRQWQFQEDFAGHAAGLRSRYYLGFLQGRPVANVSVWETGVTGNLGHVYTLETERRKGICRAVMAAQMDDFRRRGGQLLVLGTGYDSHPYHIYRSFGFQSMIPGSGAMRYVADNAFFDRFFAPGTVSWGAVEWRDLGTACALMACPRGDWLRSMRARKFGPGCYEAAFVDDVRAARQGERQVHVARCETGSATGYAVLGPDPAWNGHTWLLDVFAHPDFLACVDELLATLAWPPVPVHTYLEAGSPLVEQFHVAGFRESGRLAGSLRRDNRPVDVVVMTRA